MQVKGFLVFAVSMGTHIWSALSYNWPDVRCGRMRLSKDDHPDEWAVSAITDDNFKLLSTKKGVEAVIDSLPPDMIEDIIQDKWNSTKDRVAGIMYAEILGVHRCTYMNFLNWMIKGWVEGREVCWYTDPSGDDSLHHTDVFGALADAMFQPKKKTDYPLGVARRFTDLRPGALRTNVPICFSPKHKASRDLAKYLRSFYHSRFRDYGGIYNSYHDMRHEADSWAGSLGRTLFRLAQMPKYHCSQRIWCDGKLAKGVPMLPESHTQMWQVMTELMGGNDDFCVSFGRVPDNMMPMTYWIDARDIPSVVHVREKKPNHGNESYPRHETTFVPGTLP